VATRRLVVKAGVAGLALAAPSASSALAAAPEPAIFRAIYDDRFAEARDFARTAAARGWPVRAIQGDVTRVWFDELDLRWRAGPAAIAGVTVPVSLFCLETLARDRGLRLAARAELAGGRLVSWLIAPRRRVAS